MDIQKELGPVSRQRAGIVRLDLEDSPENRQRVKKTVDDLTRAVRYGANVAFGVGLRDGNLVMEAENLDVTGPFRKRKGCLPKSLRRVK